MLRIFKHILMITVLAFAGSMTIWLETQAMAQPGFPDPRGTWYFKGYPCYIDGRGFSLVLVNERGDRCSGRIDGDVIYADDWGLVGRLTWRAIYWNNGSTWTR